MFRLVFRWKVLDGIEGSAVIPEPKSPAMLFVLKTDGQMMLLFARGKSMGDNIFPHLFNAQSQMIAQTGTLSVGETEVICFPGKFYHFRQCADV